MYILMHYCLCYEYYDDVILNMRLLAITYLQRNNIDMWNVMMMLWIAVNYL